MISIIKCSAIYYKCLLLALSLALVLALSLAVALGLSVAFGVGVGHWGREFVGSMGRGSLYVM